MLDYMEVLGLPAAVVLALVSVFFLMQVIGGILEFKGKTAPEIMRIKKYFKKRKEEREIIAMVPKSIDKLNDFIAEWDRRYSEKNLAERDRWMNHVDERGELNQERIEQIMSTLEKHGEYILALTVEGQRNTIIEFASKVNDKDVSVTREQFNRIFRLYEDYEEIIEDNGMKNGEVDIAYRLIIEAYEERTKNGTFIEDVRGW